MSDRVAAIRLRYALAFRRAGAIMAVMLGVAVLLLIVSLARAAVPGDISRLSSSAAPNLAEPAITYATITETSDYLHADGLTLYYGGGMGEIPQDFWIGGQAEGDDLEWITCTAAFDDGPFDDSSPYNWMCGPYDVVSADSETVVITATLYDTTGTTGVETLFTCLEDTAAPASVADSPGYDTASPIPVMFTVEDDLSGLDHVRLHYWYSGTWATTEYTSTATAGVFNFVPEDGDGYYYFETVASDNVGNSEPEPSSGGGDTQTFYDTNDPTASVSSPEVSYGPSWEVSWEGTDPAPGSGIASYDVQYRVGAGGDWQDWLMTTDLTSATFGPASPESVAFETTYYFRVRARDEAGRVGDYSSAASTYVDYYYVYLPLVLRDYSPLTNGGFEDGWIGWAHGGALRQAIITNDGWSGPHSGSYAARLGDPSYACNGGVPLGTAWIERTITVPSSGVSELEVYYKIYTEDKLSDPTKYDRFEIRVNGAVELRDGIATDPFGCDTPPRTTGWRVFSFDVTGYQGTNITLRLENISAYDNWYNTWTYVDDIQFVP
jgi:hypothetical protein